MINNFDGQLTGPGLLEERLDEILAAYLDDAAIGRAPGREELLAGHPELARELASFFADRDHFDRLAGPLRQTSRVHLASLEWPPSDAPGERTPSPIGRTLTFGSGPAQLPAHTGLPSIPGYEVVGELGRGGMGIVYKAIQVSLKRPVALKMLRAGAGAAPEERARFRAEAEAVAHLRHPNIVQIHEVGEQDGIPFFSLEYVEGGSLNRRLARAPLAAHAAAALVKVLARAIHFAHLHGIVHRDLKPANILLQRKSGSQHPKSETEAATPPSDAEFQLSDFEPKVTDFGLAKRLDSEIGHTHSGAIVGTPSYMAPEQAKGLSKSVGPAADVYALGTILYECITGHPPFAAPTALETVLQVLDSDPLPPRRLQRSCPRDLETICLKCLEKAPHKRYATAEGLADDLARFLAGEPLRARPTSPAERGVKWVRRRPAVAALVGVCVAAVLGVMGLVLGYSVHLQDQVNTAIANENNAHEEKEKAERGKTSSPRTRAHG